MLDSDRPWSSHLHDWAQHELAAGHSGLLDTAVPPGCVTTARLIGVIEIEQKEKGTSWEQNDRFIAVATHAHTHKEIGKLAGHRMSGSRGLQGLAAAPPPPR